MERRKRLKNKMECHFTISVIGNNLVFDKEIRYLKSILLYADRINILSFLLSIGKKILSAQNITNGYHGIEYLKFLKNFYKEIGMPIYKDMEKFLNSLTKEDIKHFKNNVMPKEVEDSFKEVYLDAIKIFGEDEVNTIDKLINKNILKIINIKNNPNNNINEYFIEYYNEIKNYIKKSYPLFDEESNNFILSMSELGIFDLSNINKKNIRHASFVDKTILMLPSFDFLKVDEILDIKKSLIKHIDRFRGSMLKYTDEINAMPWDRDFENECYSIYSKYIAPAIEEIDELTKENSFIKNLGLNFLKIDLKTDTLPLLGIGLAQSGMLNNVFDFCSQNVQLITSIGLYALNKSGAALKEKIENDRKIRKKDLYFYYKAGKFIENRLN
ncbi:hypothetical protein [Brachyspira murdochii]|uniref:Uncharacterized protein n=1 Tax=Brachyspira murdochii (strain ATCC 51284 / DSM 12563 / 56-150) TaxID=526224 RepID=D5UBA1_BRAM5|nr:hypothetical protein [Brachyspira murdochii]ADG71974.1 hypothetical protein Bmur_1893 [Brachyspira murdochii DSM 12563]